MGGNIDLQADDGHTFSAYLAQPAGAPRAAVVALQEIFGVNAHIRSVADRFAAEGYLAVAPALFDRLGRGVELGYGDADLKAARALKAAAGRLPAPGVLRDVQAAIEHAARAGARVGVVGYCWGGLLSWRAAGTLSGLSAAVSYYGGGMTTGDEVRRTPRVPVLAHFGSQDSHIPNDSVERFRQAHPEVEVHLYPAQHGFNCEQRASHDEPSAQMARERTLRFFATYLG